MNNTKIEWADMTWNPVTGCYHGCSYCYARRIAERFRCKDLEAASEIRLAESLRKTDYPVFYLQDPYEFKGRVEPYPYAFHPTLHMYRLGEPADARESRSIFVCSMSDLFGSWVPDWWIESVLEACRRAPWHRYLVLTKNPARYTELVDKGIIRDCDENFWLGYTVTGPGGMCHKDLMHHSFMSFEPILAPWPPAKEGGDPYRFPEWVILGAETGNRRGRVVPEKGWIDNIVAECRMMRTPVFMKDSLIPIVGEQNMVREFPRGLRP